MEPKAKWQQVEAYSGEWSADVGPYVLEVVTMLGRCSIWQNKPCHRIWEKTTSTPCDVTDLMRLTEAELARRLTGAAETMDGGELVASSTTVRITFDESVTSEERMEFARSFHEAVAATLKAPAGWDVVETSTEAPRFKVGDLVRDTYGGIGRISKRFSASMFEVVFRHRIRNRADDELKLYTLPPINSYADLANVLDELPEGVVVEVLPPEATNVLYRRILQSYEYSRPEWFAGWRRSNLNNPARLTQPTLPTTKFRIVSPAEVEK